MTDQTATDRDAPTTQPTTTTPTPSTSEPAMTETRTARTAGTPDDRTSAGSPGTPVRGSRELRDAQKGESRGSAARPPIRAENGSSGESADVRASRASASSEAALFDEAAGRKLQERWLRVQTEFVDEPRAAVEKADALVAEVLQRLTDTFAREREELKAGGSRSEGSGADVSTEDLRQAIRRYRSFFNRLLTL